MCVGDYLSCVMFDKDVKSGSTAMRNPSPVRRPWVPPPALSSPTEKRVPKLKGRRQKETPNEVTDTVETKKSSEFNVKLEELLQEIRQMKTNNYNGEAERKMSHHEKTILEKSLNVVKEELMKNVSEKSALNERHSKLVEKLRRVEVDASDAVKHVVSLKEFIQTLSQEQGTIESRNESSEFIKRKEMMEKLVRLDDANKSLQNLIRCGSVEEQHIESPPSDSEDLRLKRYATEIKILQEHLQERDREILELRKKVIEIGSRSTMERESLKNEVKVHRERANKYLSVVDAIKFQSSEKDEDVRKFQLESESLKLKILHLNRENETLIIEKASLQSKLFALESQMRSDEANLRSRSDELSSRFHQMSSKATLLEVENEKLKLMLAGSQQEIEKHKREIEKLEEDESRKKPLSISKEFTLPNELNVEKKNKSFQVSFNGSDKTDRKTSVGETDESKWIKVTELWQIVQNEKSAIMKQLRDLELKLEKTEVSNVEFKKELIEKEEKLRRNNLKLQEKVQESNSLKELLEAALKDIRKFDEEAKRNSASFDGAIQTKLGELEKALQHYRSENDQLTRQKDKLEVKLSSQVNDLQSQVESLQKTNKNMQIYISFLRNSYANVFGDVSLANHNFQF